MIAFRSSVVSKEPCERNTKQIKRFKSIGKSVKSYVIYRFLKPIYFALEIFKKFTFSIYPVRDSNL